MYHHHHPNRQKTAYGSDMENIKRLGLPRHQLHTASGAAEASLHAAPSSIMAASTNRAVLASLHAAPAEEASRERDDSNGEALEIVVPQEGDEAERELRAQLHAARIVVSWLRDEAQRLVGNVLSLHARLRPKRAAV